MRRVLFSGLMSVSLAAPLAAQEALPSAKLIAQAQDRCMAPPAAWMSSKSSDDGAIYETAKANCAEPEERLQRALERDMSAGRAAEVKDILAEQEKPNFIAMLTEIRDDRVSRGAK